MSNDPLWNDFRSIWAVIGGITPPIILLGGYGLFLKQQWLMSPAGSAVVVTIPLRDWLAADARATMDIDWILQLEVMANEAHHTTITNAIRGQGFSDINPLWKFGKQLDGGQTLKVEVHAPDPGDSTAVRTDGIRVKRLGTKGPGHLHGRHNQEAVGIHLSPCPILVEGVTIWVPNVITWCIMKMTAAADQWNRSDDTNLENADRTRSLAQAEKHAVDVGRIIAMMQQRELDVVADIMEATRATPAYQLACLHRQRWFRDQSRAPAILRRTWPVEIVDRQLDLLRGWFPDPEA